MLADTSRTVIGLAIAAARATTASASANRAGSSAASVATAPWRYSQLMRV